jgi:hypothetical protein
MKSWITEELRGCVFPDQRLGKRFERLVEQLADRVGQTIPLACQDWANTKAAYRFFASERVREANILRGHFQATRDRCSASKGTVLVLHDTTEFSYRREDPAAVGKIHQTVAGHESRPRLHTVCGILMHSSLAVTTDGLPLGLAAVKFWTRKRFKGTNALRKKINPTRVAIERKESIRWIENLKQSTSLLGAPARLVHIADREGDIYELFCAAQEVGTHFLIRTQVDRLARDGTITVSQGMKEVEVKGLHRVDVVDKNGNPSQALLELRYRRIHILPPIGKQKRYPSLTLTVLHAQERKKPKGRDRINWKLITDLPVNSRRDAIQKLDWYAKRWKIETFHKVLKSGCKAEALRLRTAERLVNVIAVFCILAWRIFWMSMIRRSAPNAPATWAFTKLETQLLDRLIASPAKQSKPRHVSHYVTKLARLGGYLARKGDSPPGNMVVWRGLCRLTDIELGFAMGVRLVGN